MDHVTHLGLDVHKDTIAVAILRPDQNVPDERVIPNTPEALRKLVGRRRARMVACYEADPTGYETHRLLSSLGVPCDVIAPTLIPRRAGRRVKTDRLGHMTTTPARRVDLLATGSGSAGSVTGR